MKEVIIELKRSELRLIDEMEIIHNLQRKFKVVNDTKNQFEELRFITIDGEDLKINSYGITFELCSISKPHINVCIYKKFVYAVHVKL